MAVNRLYYACFYAITALLHKNSLDTKTHNGVIRLFGLHFIRTGIIKSGFGELYSTLFEMRQDADYEVEVDYEEQDVLELLLPAAELIAAIEKVLSTD